MLFNAYKQAIYFYLSVPESCMVYRFNPLVKLNEKKILIIEDDEATCEVLELIAAGLNCEAITSTYALPVRSILEAAPDLILLDHWLGDHLGGDLCLKLKENPLTKGIPVIIVSAHQTIKEITKQYCADDYVEKPFSIKAIEEKIRKYLAKN